MTEENIKLEEQLANAEAVTEMPEELPAEETVTAEAPAEENETKAEIPEKTEEKPVKEKKEKKHSKLVAFFANAKNGGSLFAKCLLLFLIFVALGYLGMMIWGVIDKLIPTFYNAAYFALGTLILFPVIGLVLIILMICRYARAHKKNRK